MQKTKGLPMRSAGGHKAESPPHPRAILVVTFPQGTTVERSCHRTSRELHDALTGLCKPSGVILACLLSLRLAEVEKS